MHLTAVNDHHDNRAVLRLTDGRARLLLVQAGACDQILAVDDERRVELHRVAQTGGIVKRTDLQVILVVKADDLPAVAYCVLILLSPAFQEAHTDRTKTPGVDLTTGSLGQGMSTATGAALGNKLDGRDSHVFVFVGDGECDEGQVWEAAQFAAHYKLDNLVCFVDDNKYQLDGAVDKVMSHGKGIGAKFAAFGWNVIELQDGNDVEQIYDAVQLAYDTKGVPTCIVLNTVKGLGATFAEGTGAHSSQPTKEQWDEALAAAEKKLAEIKAQ